MLSVRPSDDPALATLLGQHPMVVIEGVPTPVGTLSFCQDGWQRSVVVGGFHDVGGLPELADNNPWVCADTVTVPDALSTLVILALGPLMRAGLIAEMPVLQVSQVLSDAELHGWLCGLGWNGGEVVLTDPQDLGTVVALNAMVEIETPEAWGMIDDLYQEAYGRSFYVGLAEFWDVNTVLATPSASYQLRMTPDEPRSLLTVQVMADLNGKLGAAQLVHTMNIMAGFEEHLGLQAR